ncbi:MAG: hypothetical protein ACI8ZQ_000311 [Bacteroidia bacterium]|jgi:hypothetical protein
MKNLFKLSLIAFMAFSFASCSDDTTDPTPETDIREQMTGTYTYVNTDIDVDGNEDEYTGTMVIQKSTTSDGIVFLEDGEVFAKGNKLRSATDGVAFDLEDDRQTLDGTLYEFKGIDFIELGGAKYSGAFEASSNEVGIAFDVFEDGTRIYSSIYVLTKI